MRVFGTEKDYYDSIQGLYHDPKVVYERKPLDEKIKKWPFESIYSPYLRNVEMNIYVIGFCGKVYPCIGIMKHGSGTESFHYTLDAVDSAMESLLSENELKVYRGDYKARRKVTPPNQRRWDYWSVDRRNFEVFFEGMKKKQDHWRDMFLKAERPVFVAQRWRKPTVIEWDVVLRRYDFFKVFPPYQAFQEVEMFISNLSVPDKKMPVIPNDDRIESHGFDLRKSFRKSKQE